MCFVFVVVVAVNSVSVSDEVLWREMMENYARSKIMFQYKTITTTTTAITIVTARKLIAKKIVG